MAHTIRQLTMSDAPLLEAMPTMFGEAFGEPGDGHDRQRHGRNDHGGGLACRIRKRDPKLVGFCIRCSLLPGTIPHLSRFPAELQDGAPT